MNRRNQKNIEKVASKNALLKRHRTSVVITGIAVCFLTVMVGVKAVGLYQQKQAYIQKENALSKQIEEEQERSAQAEAYQEYVQSDEYVKDVASEELGLAESNEVIFQEAE